MSSKSSVYANSKTSTNNETNGVTEDTMSSNVENDLLHRAESESQISSMSRVDSTVPPIPVAEPSGDINTRTNSAVAGAVPRRKTTQKKMTTTTSVAISRRTLENQYTTKRKRYLLLKKELVQKQKATQDLYDDISELRKKLLACGAKDPGKLDNFKTTEALPVKSSIDKNVRARDNFEEETVVPYKENPSFNVDFVVAMTEKLKDIPRNCHELCQAAIEKHSAIATWLAELKSEVDVVDPSILTRIESFRSENENLRLQLNDLTSFQTETVSDIAQNASALFNEYETCCSRLKRLDTTVSDQEDRKEIRDRLNAALCELRFERDENIETKERRSQAETHLQKARTRIRDLENRVASDENKIQQLQNTQKSLEVQLKQKEQSIEQRMKDVHKTMKNNDGLVTKMEKQRDTLEARLKELKEKMTAKEIESLDTAKEMTEKMEALNSEINEEREKREQMENAYAEMEERYRDLEGKSQELCLLAEKNKGFSVTDANHTENEIRLFNDLQIERAEVEKQKEEIARLEEEKEEITAVMHQAANEAEDESKDKLAADLIVKSNDLQNLTMEYMRLQRVTNDFEEKNKALEEQLIEIRNQLHAQSKEGGKAAWGVHVIELQQQISDLRNNLAEVTSHNENLETKLTQKQLELEQRDRIMREQSKFLKVKDELLGLLKGKEARLDSSRENSNEDENLEDINQINEQIAAKTEAIQELYSTLENKQMQVMRLEKIVKQMEDHQDHAQAQRTRLENRIAQLELALQEKNKDHRSRGFGIL